MDTTFNAELFEWRGPAPFYWFALPEDVCDYVRAQAAEATYGWGAIPVCARIGATEWETSLLPRDGGYVLPVKKVVRTQERFSDGDTVTVAMSVAPAVVGPRTAPARPCEQARRPGRGQSLEGWLLQLAVGRRPRSPSSQGGRHDMGWSGGRRAGLVSRRGDSNPSPPECEVALARN